MDIYTQLREILRSEYERGATDQEIADRLGCSQQQVNNLRNGRRTFAKMRLETLLKLFPKLSIALEGVPLHGQPTTAINGHVNIISGRDSNGNSVTISGQEFCQAELERLRSGLLQSIIDLDIEDSAKVAILRHVSNYGK